MHHRFLTLACLFGLAAGFVEGCAARNLWNAARADDLKSYMQRRDRDRQLEQLDRQKEWGTPPAGSREAYLEYMRRRALAAQAESRARALARGQLPPADPNVRQPQDALKTERTFPLVPLTKLAEGHWVRPRATVQGIVVFSKVEGDGDLHVRLRDPDGSDAFIVCERVPEFGPAGRPKPGDRIEVRGIVRFDGEHKWWEVHPVLFWKTVPTPPAPVPAPRQEPK